MSTYQTRIAVYEGRDRAEGDAGLSAYAELYGRVQRKLFADVVAGRSAASLKRDYIKKHGIPARLFNGVRVSLDGKVASVRGSQRLQQDSLQRRIDRAQRQVPDAAERGRWDQVHQKKRRLANLRHRLVGLEADIAEGRVRLCFGSRRLWRKQHYLEQNGYASHAEWLQDWQDARSNEFFVLGSRDETSGCQLCVASIADDGSLTLRLRMPDCLANQHGKYLVIPHVRFAYGHEQVLAALGSNAEYVAYRREHGDQAARATALGQAISYRFKRDAKGWRVFVSTEMRDVPVVTDRRRGAIGVDLNADHLAVAETDASGNGERALHHPSLRQRHEGVQFVAFHHFHRGSQQALHRSGKGLPGVTPVHQHLLDLVEVGPVFVKHRHSPSPVGNVGGSHVYRMGQSWRVHRDVTLDSRHLLACVIALVPGGVRVLDALGVHDVAAGLLFPTIALSGRANQFF